MRTDTGNFAQANLAKSKRPRWVVEIAFDSANTILWYFTSHTDTALPPGVVSNVTSTVIENLSGTSQTLNPDKAQSTIGSVAFDLVDRAGQITDVLGDELVLGRSTRQQRVRVFMGFEGLAWADYTLLPMTQLITEIAYDEGVYSFKCNDIQREMRKDIFVLSTTRLSSTLAKGATTMSVLDTSLFELVPHGSSYGDAPNVTVGYVRLDDEIIRYTGKTSTTFTGCTRGALNTVDVDHPVDPASDVQNQPEVKEYVYLELPAVDLLYRVLTGKNSAGTVVMPTNWHMGISTTYVRLSDFTSIGTDLWDPANADSGFPARFEDLEKYDGKQFAETELCALVGTFMPIYSDGALGLKRMASTLAGAAYVHTIDETNLVKGGPLVYDMGSLHNILEIDWNWETLRKDFGRKNLLVDGTSIVKHKRGLSPFVFRFRGLHGSRASSTVLQRIFAWLRDRYSGGPPFRRDVTIVPSMNVLEIGDVVRHVDPFVRDFVANSTLDRSFEIQNVAIDWIQGGVACKLFASSEPAGPIAATSDNQVIADAWYASEGTALSSVVTIVGANPGHVTVGGNLAGNDNLTNTGAIYHYEGDLVIDPGVTITINKNAWLRVRGFLQVNGKIDGKGRGLAGAVGPVTPTSPTDWTLGTSGFIGTTESGGGIVIATRTFQGFLQRPDYPRGAVVKGRNDVVPEFNLTWNGATLPGAPTDLRGSAGSSGASNFLTSPNFVLMSAGGNGGNGGAGLGITSRGIDIGVNGQIDLSGADGIAGASVTELSFGGQIYAGSGAGGAPGGLLIMLDGLSATASGITEASVVLLNGKTPIKGGTYEDVIHNLSRDTYSAQHGTGDGTEVPLPSLSGPARGGTRIQYIPGNVNPAATTPEAFLPMPTGIGLASGTSELLRASDGTIIVRVKVTWSPVLDSRVAGYDLQFKRSADTIWSSAPSVIGQASDTAWISNINDGVNYDFQVRAAGRAREVSDWLTITNYLVIGKTAPPTNVGTLLFTDPFLSWAEITDLDIAGYIVRYQPGTSTVWATAIPAHKEGFITPTRFDTGDIVGGQTTMLVKSVDTSGNEATTAANITVDLRPPVPTSFFINRQPDGTREFTWALTTPPADLAGYHLRYFLGSTSDWDAMTPMHNGLLQASPFETNQLAAGTYTFALKSVDRAGNESATAIFITSVTIGDPRIAGSIDSFKEEPTWTETKTSCHLDGATGWLVASGTGTWATAATWAAMDAWVITPAGSIQYERLIDVGIVTAFVPLVTVVADGSITIEEAHSDTGSGYSSFVAVGPELTTRFIKIRVTIAGAFPKLKSMFTILSATPVEEIIEDLDTSTLTGAFDLGVGNIRLPITEAYNVIKSVNVTLQNVGAGWTWELLDKDTTVGPHVKIYNNLGILSDAVIDANVKGV